MEFKADALLLRAADYGENDKMVTLLTAERGKVGAAMKGVRKAGAKLRFAAQPFCFAEYVLAARGERYTVTQASLHDGFYDLRLNIKSYYAAACITEVCDLLAREGEPCGALLVCAVEALGRIEQSPETPDPALVCFLIEVATLEGYPLMAGKCPSCGKEIVGRRFFDMASGAFNCAACALGVPASESTYEVVKAVLAGEDTLPEGTDGYIRAIRLLKTYLTFQTDLDFPAIAEYLRI